MVLPRPIPWKVREVYNAICNTYKSLGTERKSATQITQKLNMLKHTMFMADLEIYVK